MSGTDQAFIRAFADPTAVVRSTPSASHHEPAAGGSASASGSDSGHPIVSQFLTSATFHHPTLESPAAESRSRSHHSHAEPATKAVAVMTATSEARRPARSQEQPSASLPGTAPATRVRRFRLGAVGEPLPRSTVFRRDDGNSHATGPHLPLTSFPDGASHGHRGASSVSGDGAGDREPGVADRDETRTVRIDAANPDPRVGSRLVPFRPQWEVDSLQYPAICSRLQTESAEGLAELLRAVLLRAWRGRGTLAVTSFDGGAGVTTISLCIARLAASFDVQAVILDGHCAEPGLARALGIKPDLGWSDLRGEQSIAAAAIGGLDDRLVVIPAAADDHPIRQQAFPELGRILKTLRESFELVLIDVGPMFHAAKRWFQRSLHLPIDGALVVRDVRRTTLDQLDDVCFRLREYGVEDVSVIDNFQSHLSHSPRLEPCTNDSGI